MKSQAAAMLISVRNDNEEVEACVVWIGQEIKDSKSKLDDAAYKAIVHILSKF